MDARGERFFPGLKLTLARLGGGGIQALQEALNTRRKGVRGVSPIPGVDFHLIALVFNEFLHDGRNNPQCFGHQVYLTSLGNLPQSP